MEISPILKLKSGYQGFSFLEPIKEEPSNAKHVLKAILTMETTTYAPSVNQVSKPK
jgi:hypothetical protein